MFAAELVLGCVLRGEDPWSLAIAKGSGTFSFMCVKSKIKNEDAGLPIV